MNNFTKRAASAAEQLTGVLEILPRGLCSEITRLAALRRDFPLGLSEIRVRAHSPSSLVISGENLRLRYRVSESEMNDIYDKALGGALFAHVDEIKNGFISMRGGIRVGISSSRREAGLLPTDISALVFRLPSAHSESAGGIFTVWHRERPRGTLIYSAPGGGKTSALRAIAGIISRECALRVAVVDERREFRGEDYSGCMVDLLSGYGKAEGIEIAMRTLSPQLIVTDEIGSEREAEALLSVGRGGIPIIASVHADSLDEALSRSAVKRLADEGYFELFVRLYREKGKFSFEHCVRVPREK